jgi:hypothetical protein
MYACREIAARKKAESEREKIAAEKQELEDAKNKVRG